MEKEKNAIRSKHSGLHMNPAKKREDANQLGISRSVYAIGNSFKDALIWGTAATAGLIGVIAVGRNRSGAVRWLAENIEKAHVGTKEFTQRLLKGASQSTGIKLKV